MVCFTSQKPYCKVNNRSVLSVVSVLSVMRVGFVVKVYHKLVIYHISVLSVINVASVTLWSVLHRKNKL